MNELQKEYHPFRDITPKQLKTIHALISALRLTDSCYREILWEKFKLKSSKELCMSQANCLIEEFEETAVKCGVWEKNPFKEKHQHLAGRSGFASLEQLVMIEGLWEMVSRMDTPESKAKALRGFLFRVAGVSDLRFLNKSGAGKVIIALRAMKKKQTEKKECL